VYLALLPAALLAFFGSLSFLRARAAIAWSLKPAQRYHPELFRGIYFLWLGVLSLQV